jgi:hypothetical protein
MKTLVLKSKSDENFSLLIQLAEKLGFFVSDETVNSEEAPFYHLSEEEIKEINIGRLELKKGKGLSSAEMKNSLQKFL